MLKTGPNKWDNSVLTFCRKLPPDRSKDSHLSFQERRHLNYFQYFSYKQNFVPTRPPNRYRNQSLFHKLLIYVRFKCFGNEGNLQEATT